MTFNGCSGFSSALDLDIDMDDNASFLEKVGVSLRSVNMAMYELQMHVLLCRFFRLRVDMSRVVDIYFGS